MAKIAFSWEEANEGASASSLLEGRYDGGHEVSDAGNPSRRSLQKRLLPLEIIIRQLIPGSVESIRILHQRRRVSHSQVCE